MIELRAVTDRDHGRIVDLVGLRAVRTEEALDQRGTDIGADAQQRAGVGGRRLAARDMDDMQRLCGRRVFRDIDHDAVCHQRRVQREHRARTGVVAQQQVMHGFVGQHACERADGQPALEGGHIRQRRHEGAIDQHQAAGAVGAACLQRLFGAVQCGLVGRGCRRQHVAHQGTQVRVLPVLDPAVRQPFARECIERARAHGGDRLAARQARQRRGELLRQGTLEAACLDDCVHRLKPPALRTGCSRSLPAPAPAPCRRSSPRGPSTSRAHGPARCSSEAADSG